MADLTAIREGLKARLDTISGLRAYAYMPPSPQPPAVGISIQRSELDVDLDGNGRHTFYLWLYVNSGDLTRAQTSIDTYLATTGEYSIKAAIESEPSLGGAADWARVTGWDEGPRLVDAAGSQLLAMPITCVVMA